MLLREFSERAAECIELARAWCGVTEETPNEEPRPRH
jgi:hypothetical protein